MSALFKTTISDASGEEALKSGNINRNIVRKANLLIIRPHLKKYH
jgi:hypothetical protein